MKVIRIKSSAEDVSMIKRILGFADACNSIFILDSTEQLYKFIEIWMWTVIYYIILR